MLSFDHTVLDLLFTDPLHFLIKMDILACCRNYDVFTGENCTVVTFGIFFFDITSSHTSSAFIE